VIDPDGEINADTRDLPRDMVALFEMIDFLPPEAVDAITPTGTITWGEPSGEGEPYLEIDQDSGDYRIESGRRPNGIDPEDETLDESHYEEDVQRYFSPMGVAILTGLIESPRFALCRTTGICFCGPVRMANYLK